MSVLRGQDVRVYIRTSKTGLGTLISNLSDSTLKKLKDIKESMYFGDEYKGKKVFFKDFNITLNGDYNSADAGQQSIEDIDECWLEVFFNTELNPGKLYPCIVESVEIKAQTGDYQKISITLTGNGIPEDLASHA